MVFCGESIITEISVYVSFYMSEFIIQSTDTFKGMAWCMDLGGPMSGCPIGRKRLFRGGERADLRERRGRQRGFSEKENRPFVKNYKKIACKI